MKRKVELLSPAGSYESMVAAAAAGCDAVYIGGSRFGARAFADNLNQDKMFAAIDFMHVRGKKLYLTVNTLLKEEELSEVYDYIEPFYVRGLDAVIVQDFGVMRFLHRNFPELPIHASTQMTLTMAEGAELLKDYGVTRLVPARELTLGEIRKMRGNTDLEIETFIHGALCYCYSGQCLMSSMLGGRSGNRGRCAQTCRMEYGADGKKGYLLSPKDICTLEILPELLEAGIDSFKIEGRMKRYEYAAGVTSVYRKHMVQYENLGPDGYRDYRKKHEGEWKEDLLMLSDLYNRGGFSGGYYKTAKGPAMMAMDRPNHSGVLAGRVKQVRGMKAEIELELPIHAGDVLEIRGGASDYDFTVGQENGRDRGTIGTNFKPQAGVRAGLPVYRTKNDSLLKRLSERYLESARKLPVRGSFQAEAGKPVRLTAWREGISVSKEGLTAEPAKNLPVTEDRVREQLVRTGETPFEFEQLDIRLSGSLFLPIGKLGVLRREALSELENRLAERGRRAEPRRTSGYAGEAFPVPAEDPAGESAALPEAGRTVSAVVQTPGQLNGVLAAGIRMIYLDTEGFRPEEIPDAARTAGNAGAVCFVRLPHIFSERILEIFEKSTDCFTDPYVDGFLVRNLEELAFLKKRGLSQKRIHADYQLYAMNRESAAVLQELGADEFTAPVELNAAELAKLDLKHATTVVYGRLPLMVSEQCVYKNTFRCKKGNAESLVLKDRLGKRFPVIASCIYCYNTILNSVPLSLLDAGREWAAISAGRARLDFTIEGGKETERIARAFRAVFELGEKTDCAFSDYTRGHFKRGID